MKTVFVNINTAKQLGDVDYRPAQEYAPPATRSSAISIRFRSRRESLWHTIQARHLRGLSRRLVVLHDCEDCDAHHRRQPMVNGLAWRLLQAFRPAGPARAALLAHACTRRKDRNGRAYRTGRASLAGFSPIMRRPSPSDKQPYCKQSHRFEYLSFVARRHLL
jgi:hypothetical protein